MTAVDARFAGGPVLVDTAELGCTGQPVVGLDAPGYYVDLFAHEARALAAALITAADAVDQKNAPAAGSHQREGENRNPYERNRSVTNPTPELATAAESLGVPIESALPDAWATETEIADVDSDPMITHTREEFAGDFHVVLSHTISNIDLGTDALVKWDELGAEGGVTPEEFVISVSSIPGLIAALQRAHALCGAATREKVTV